MRASSIETVVHPWNEACPERSGLPLWSVVVFGSTSCLLHLQICSRGWYTQYCESRVSSSVIRVLLLQPVVHT